MTTKTTNTMTQQTEKICFRYDGSEEAKKCIIWINETFKRPYDGVDAYYDNQGDCRDEVRPNHRLVTPAEFLRLVSEPQWKVGDECMIDEQHNLKTYKIEHITSDNVCMLNCLTIDKGYTIRHLSTLRPVRKSLREELLHLVAQHPNKHHQTITDEILSKFNVTHKH